MQANNNNMSSLSEIVFSIIDTVRPKNITGDSINKEIVAFHVKNVRAQLIKQQIGKYGTLDISYTQPIGCLSLVLADKSECCSYPTGCKILKTTVNIPATIGGSTSLLTRIGPVDPTAEPFNPIEFERVPFAGYNKYTKNIKKWFKTHANSPIYILVSDEDYLAMSLEFISGFGVFENPEDLTSFVNCLTGESCFSYDSRYPVPDSMIPLIQDMVIKNFLSIQTKAPIDSTNDSQVNPTPQNLNK